MTSLLDGLRLIKDSRSRHGRIYPLWGILTLLILAAMHGETSLRGMGLWGKLRAEQLVRRLGLWRYPSLSTIWYILRNLDTGILEEALRPWRGTIKGYGNTLGRCILPPGIKHMACSPREEAYRRG